VGWQQPNWEPVMVLEAGRGLAPPWRQQGPLSEWASVAAEPMIAYYQFRGATPLG